jgi:Domain of unknown function (DUF4815)
MLNFDVAPYYDDFDAENGAINNNYMRILFKPGYAVQARELTQSQSILQNQISSFADNIFQNGSPVSGGHLTYDNTVTAIQLQPTYQNTPVSISDFQDQLITNSQTQILQKAIVVATDDSLSSNTSAGAIVVKYMSGFQFGLNDVIVTDSPGETQYTAQILSANVSNTNLAISDGSIVSINDGVFYVNGFFIKVPAQTIVLDSQNTAPSYRVGLEIQEGIVNYTADSSLLDPAQGSFNYQAPGADRYQFNLVLSKRSLSQIDDSAFFELMRIENGIITNQVNYSLYSKIGDTMARNIYNQSGDFTITPFVLTVKDNQTDNLGSTFLMSLSPGWAYIKGYEFQTLGSTVMTNKKARTSNTSTDYTISLEYGNYLIVNNVHTGTAASMNIAGYTQYDLNILPSGLINTQNATAYANSTIGTAKLRNLEYDGSSALSTTYYAYLLDVNVHGLVGNAYGHLTDTSNTIALQLPPTFADVPDLYIGKTLSVLAGNCSGDVRTVTAYDEANNRLVVSSNFSQLPDSNTQFSLNFTIGDVNSLVVPPSTFTQNVYSTQPGFNPAVTYPSMDIDVTSKNPVAANGSTTLYLTNDDCLVFELPQSYIVQDSINNVTFYNRKFFPNVSFDATGSSTFAVGNNLSSTETFDFGYTNAFVPRNQANSKVIVAIRSNVESQLNFANGSLLSFDYDGPGGVSSFGNSVYQTDASSITIKANSAIACSNAFIADVILTVKENAGAISVRRSKYAFGNTSNTQLKTTDTPFNGTVVQGIPDSSVRVDSSNGYIWFTNPAILNTSPGSAQSLYIPDVTDLIKIYDSGNPAYAPNVQNTLIDITDSYILNSGQTDNYYDHASLILRAGYPAPTGQIVVMTRYYNHSNTSGFFTGNSYPSVDYQTGKIPVYVSPAKGSLNLRDAIDFRPTRANGIVTDVRTFTLQGAVTPQPDLNMQLSYAYYLPRIDKLTLTKNKQFRIISGAPSTNPVPPSDASDAMTLWQINIPAYTDDISKIQLNYVDNRRYTMSDIGGLNKRITQLEYYVTLNQQQQNALNQTTTYVNDPSLSKTAYGIVADSFTDFSIADNSSTDTLCYIYNGTMKPFHSTTPISFNLLNVVGPYSDNEKTYSLEYTETPAVVQNTANSTVVVQPYAFGQFLGELSLTPQTDVFYSQALPPVYVSPTVPTPPITSPPPRVLPPVKIPWPVSSNAAPVLCTGSVVVGSKVRGGGSIPTLPSRSVAPSTGITTVGGSEVNLGSSTNIFACGFGASLTSRCCGKSLLGCWSSGSTTPVGTTITSQQGCLANPLPSSYNGTNKT